MEIPGAELRRGPFGPYIQMGVLPALSKRISRYSVPFDDFENATVGLCSV
jgi:hypothetical protein